ncbi:MAG: signal peptidase II [Phycisphaerae bacterium]
MGHAASHARLWIATGLGLAADLWTKEWAFRSFRPHESRVVIQDLCNLQLSLNPGALFGIGAGLAPIFVGASVLALIFVLYLFANSAASRWSMHIALGFVLAGALGNLYDRTTQQAYVVHTPRGRDIGRLVDQNDRYVTIGDYQSGNNRRSYKRPLDPRSGLQPVVRDFIKIEARIGKWSLWPWIFNVADALLVIGVVILLIAIRFDRRHRKEVGAAAHPADEGSTQAG